MLCINNAKNLIQPSAVEYAAPDDQTDRRAGRYSGLETLGQQMSGNPLLFINLVIFQIKHTFFFRWNFSIDKLSWSQVNSYNKYIYIYIHIIIFDKKRFFLPNICGGAPTLFLTPLHARIASPKFDALDRSHWKITMALPSFYNVISNLFLCLIISVHRILTLIWSFINNASIIFK